MTLAKADNLETKNSLPKGWRWVRLGEICQDNLETHDPTHESNSPFVYVDISSVDAQSKRIVNSKQLLGKNAPSRARKVIKANDVIVATTRPNLNAVAMVPENFNNQICSTGFCVLRPSVDLNASYLFFFVQTGEFVESLSNLVKGALYPAVTDNQVKSQLIPLPPTLAEQERVSHILNEQMANVEKARTAAETRLEAVKALPEAYLRRFFENEKSSEWQKVRLGDILRVKSGNFLPANNMNTLGKYPVYGGNGINGYHDDFMFNEPKIIIGRVGAQCGCICVSESNSWITDNALYVSDKLKPFDDAFMELLLKKLDLNNKANSMAQPLVSGKIIYDIETSLPDVDKQKQIAISVHKIYDEIEALFVGIQEELKTIDALPNALLQRAFSGGL